MESKSDPIEKFEEIFHPLLDTTRSPRKYKSIIMAILGSIGLAIIFTSTININKKVSAIKNTAIEQDYFEKFINPTKSNKFYNDQPFYFGWTIQETINMLRYVGFIVCSTIFGRMCDLISWKWMMTVAMLFNIIFSTLSPPAAFVDYYFFELVKFFHSAAISIVIPAMHVMILKQTSPNERSILLAIIYVGIAFGNFFGVSLSDFVIKNHGWELLMSIESVMSLVWCIIWWFTIDDVPEENLKEFNKPKKLPIKQILTSLPCIAVFFAYLCCSIGSALILIVLPKFANLLFPPNLTDYLTLTLRPYICMGIFIVLLNSILVMMQERKYISLTTSRKIGTFCSSVAPIICLLVIASNWENKDRIIIPCLTIGTIFLGGLFCGFLINYMDIAPNYVGILTGITTGFALIAFTPGFLNYITSQYDEESLIIDLHIAGRIFIIGVIFYCLFGSAEEESWNKKEDDPDKK